MPEAMPSAMLSFELSALPMLNCSMLNCFWQRIKVKQV